MKIASLKNVYNCNIWYDSVGSRRLVRTLLTLGANPNAQDNAEWSPLHEACNRGNLGVVKLLHKYGADINLKGFGRDTPLHDAARNGQIKVSTKFFRKTEFHFQRFGRHYKWYILDINHFFKFWKLFRTSKYSQTFCILRMISNFPLNFDSLAHALLSKLRLATLAIEAGKNKSFLESNWL